MCPHRGLPLSTGRIEDDELVCAYHGLRFGSDGQCRKIPEKLALQALECFRITVFPAAEITDHHALRDLALDEHRRLFKEMEPATAAHALLPSRA